MADNTVIFNSLGMRLEIVVSPGQVALGPGANS